MQGDQPILESAITSPHCGHREAETMPIDACLFFYDCKDCGARLQPKRGDCCVFCSQGTVPCRPIQASGRTSICCADGNRTAAGQIASRRARKQPEQLPSTSTTKRGNSNLTRTVD